MKNKFYKISSNGKSLFVKNKDIEYNKDIENNIDVENNIDIESNKDIENKEVCLEQQINVQSANSNSKDDDFEYVKTPFFLRGGIQSFIASLICVLVGLFIGYIVLFIIKPSQATSNFIDMLKNFMKSPRTLTRLKNLGNTLTKAAPLILTGLSILFAYKSGLFNIGVAGQYTVGAAASLIAALQFKLPWYICIIFAMLSGGLWALIVGLFKAFLNVNEVIAGIMLNWIGLYLSNALLKNEKIYFLTINESHKLTDPVHGSLRSMIPQMGLDKLFGNNPSVGLGIIISIVVSIIVLIVLNKTTFGYELKATGNNRFAAKYAGIKEKSNILITMFISGSIAGLSAAILYLTGYLTWVYPSSCPSMGFDGISSAFLGGLNPIGTIFSSFFVMHIKDGGGNLDTKFYSSEISALITSLIIYLCAFTLFIKSFLNKIFAKKRKKNKEE